ncbi:hypothetical protein HK100_007369 [Physocladia obscura]|uniref:Macro domain-containing protein n=1 Tax=Physocladia obscura TaxID=109957 RepID=A0AAD5T5R6_9FUNG|nr:hypothetical protein HK100_007369 [Physocladia obscura]
MGCWDTYCLLCGIGMTSHGGYEILPESMNDWWNRQRALEIETAEFSPIGTAGTYGDLEQNEKKSVREWDSLPIDFEDAKDTDDKRFTFNLYDQEAALSYQFHSKCAALLVQKLSLHGYSVQNLVDWLEVACPVNEDLAQSIPGMPDPFEIGELQEQSFLVYVGKLWILAPFDGPAIFDRSTQKTLSSTDIELWKNNMEVELDEVLIDDEPPNLGPLVPRIFRYGCYNSQLWLDRSENSCDLRTKIRIWKGDITALSTDAIVNSTNTILKGTGAAEKAIHRAAGPDLAKECKAAGKCSAGQAKITGAYNLPCKRIIHTVGPNDGDAGTLKSCYQSCFKIAATKKLKSIAFPCIATARLGFPASDAAKIALESAKEFLDIHFDSFNEVVFCVFSDGDLKVYTDLVETVFPPTVPLVKTSVAVMESNGNPFLVKLGILNVDVCLRMIEYLDLSALLKLFACSKNWHALGKRRWKIKCRDEGFACIPGQEAEVLGKAGINWQRMYFCDESRSRRRVNDSADWILKCVKVFNMKK